MKVKLTKADQHRKLTVWVDKPMYEFITQECEKRDRHMSTLIRILVKKHADKMNAKKEPTE